jgi:ADP-ribosylglycohydrolase
MCWADGFDAFNKNVLGPSSKIALRAIKNGDDIALLDNLGTTNGAAMRVAPLGCLMPTSSPSEFISLVEVASSPTHKSDVAVAGAVVIAWAVSKAIDGETWSDILTTLPGIADKAQDKTINTFSPRMSSRIKLALDVVARHSGIEEASEAVYNFVGAGTSTIESVPAAIAMVDLAKCDAKTCAILCANLGGDTDTIGAMATAICGAINGFSSLDKQLIQQLDDANKVDFRIYTKEFLQFRAEKEVSYASR